MPGAQFNLGVSHQKSFGVPVNYDEAVKWFRLSAEQGFDESMNALGSMLAIGRATYSGLQTERDSEPTDPDAMEAVEWFRKAAGMGNEAVMHSLGLSYHFGHGVGKNPQEMAKWFLASAEKGYEKAELAIGIAYAEGNGVPRDMDEAMVWWKKAAEKGNEEAKFYVERYGPMSRLMERMMAMRDTRLFDCFGDFVNEQVGGNSQFT